MDGDVSMLTGRGGEGKSLHALQIAIMVARGGEYAWWKARHRRNVLLLNAEDNVDELRRRLLAACSVMSIDADTLTNLFILDARDLVLVTKPPEEKVSETPLYGELAEIIERRDIGLVIIDPLVEAHAGLDENSNVDMKDLVVRLRRLARNGKIPVLVVHHSRKGSASGDQDGARGASALVNACRSVNTLERMSEEEHGRFQPPLERERYVRVNGAKVNYAGRIGDRWLELVSITLANGDEAPGFRRVEFGKIEEGFDARTSDLREPILELVSKGRGGGLYWSTAERGPKISRLDAALSTMLKRDMKQARDIIERFEDAGLIERRAMKDESRHGKEVWWVRGMQPPADMEKLPF
jgi:hypothetical protein